MTDEPEKTFSGRERFPASGGPARQLVVLFHGVGGQSRDVLAIADAWRAALPDAAFLAPDGPHPFDMQPTPGARQWFSVKGITRENRPSRVAAVAPVVQAYLDRELAVRGLDDSALALAGFSQGAILSLYLALRRRKPVAGVVAFSGRLADPDDAARHIVSKPPVLLIHGDQDPVIPVADMMEAAAVLTSAGVPVDTEVRTNLAHMIDLTGIERGLAFLRSRFAIVD